MKPLFILLILPLLALGQAPQWIPTPIPGDPIRLSSPPTFGSGAPSNPCPKAGASYIDTVGLQLYACATAGGNWFITGNGAQGPTGPAGPVGSSATATLTSSGAANQTLTITHNFGTIIHQTPGCTDQTGSSPYPEVTGFLLAPGTNSDTLTFPVSGSGQVIVCDETSGGGNSSGGGTGNAASTVAVSFSATPTYTCPSSTAGTVTDFLVAQLTGNITSSTLASCTSGQEINFVFQQPASGGPYTAVMPAGFDPAPLSQTASIYTTLTYLWDGTHGRLLNSTNDTQTLITMSERAASGTPAPASALCWPDSTDHAGLECKANNSANIFQMIPRSGTTTTQALFQTGSAGIPAYRAIATTDLPSIATTFDCETYANLTACLNAAKTFVTTNETGSGLAARVLLANGVQSLPPVVAALTLTAAGNASAGATVYTGTITGGGSNAFAGLLFVVSGFDNAVNNGLFAATASTTTTLTLNNAVGVSDTHAGSAMSPYQLNSGMQLVGVMARTEYTSGTFPNISLNGGTVIDCGGSSNTCFAGNGIRGVVMSNIAFQDFGSIMFAGQNNVDGIAYSNFENVYAEGSATAGVTANGFVFYNPASVRMLNINIQYVNTCLNFTQQSSAFYYGNSSVDHLVCNHYAKSVANGNSTVPALILQTLTPATGSALNLNVMNLDDILLEALGSGDGTGTEAYVVGISGASVQNSTIRRLQMEGNSGLYGLYMNFVDNIEVQITDTFQNTHDLGWGSAQSFANTFFCLNGCTVGAFPSGGDDDLFFGHFNNQPSGNLMRGCYILASGQQYCNMQNGLINGNGIMANSSTSTTTSFVAHATSTAGIYAPSAIVTGDLPAPFSIANTTTTVTGATFNANTCSGSTTVTMTGVASTNSFVFTSNADTAGLTGWGSTGGLVIDAWPTTNTLNYKVCNQTSSNITSSTITFNVGVR